MAEVVAASAGECARRVLSAVAAGAGAGAGVAGAGAGAGEG
jgi:hypothetical protein